MTGIVDIAGINPVEFYSSIYTLLRTGKSNDSRPFIFVKQDGVIYELRERACTTDGLPAGTIEARDIPDGAEIVIRVSELTKLQESLGQNCELGSRERNNLLRCIASILWGFNIKPMERGAAGELVKKMMSGDYGTVSVDTAKKWIDDINKLERRPRR